ncbi:MAG: autotransporter-associated beta strand repeat-containing protein [Pirellulales bacterium]|nr:autotransporter-associated beta strand repeat-containing protein [Pirellulales bacterium]
MSLSRFAHASRVARPRRDLARFGCSILAVALLGAVAPVALAQRITGIDVSAWQGNISQSGWNSAYNSSNMRFAFIRSSRGGTTGFDRRADGFTPGNNSYTGSQRYDDPYFGQNITRATTAGMFAGPYHFARLDVVAEKTNSDGSVVQVSNTGSDEANHFIEMAGAWMRPGYLVPVYDLEAGQGDRTANEIAQFSLDFSNRIYEAMGIRPAMYINGNYSSILQNASASLRNQLAQPAQYTPSVVGPAFPVLWDARYANQSDPGSIPIQTGSPKTTPTTNNAYYGPWDDYGVSEPWDFWQYASTGPVSGISSAMDVNVARGDIEFVKDKLVPAVWMNDSSGDWSTLANWNSGQAAVAPIVAPNQSPVQGTTVLPTPRLPGAAGSGPTSGQHDTVIIERPNAAVTVTVSTGTHNVRKLYMRETLAVTGGTLTINYDPNYVSDTVNFPSAARSGPISAQFSGPASLVGSGNLNVNTLQIDAQQTFTVGSTGTLSLARLNLMPHASNPARLLLSGNLNFTPLAGAAAVVANGSGGGQSGRVDLGGEMRTFNVANGAAAVDLTISAPVINGGLTKTGAGTLALTGANTYAGDTAVHAGTLRTTTPYLANSADVYLTSGATLDLNFAGTDLIRSFYIDGAPQAAGTWGGIGSAAQFTTPLITGTGLLSVTTAAAPPVPGMGNVLDDFEVDEGRFGWAYNTSPASQTFGLSPATTIERVTTEAHTGVGSQELNFVSTGGAWQIRHNSGLGTPADPSGNVALPATGHIGFWLKTNDPGVTVRIALDDPTSADRGIVKDVIADGQWHLYQWNLNDPAQWEAWATGDGVITGPTLTIDSIFFAGTDSAVVYLDNVSHNPLSQLAGPADEDFNADGVIDGADLSAWQAGFGLSGTARRIDGDADVDRNVDGADFLAWQRAASAVEASPAAGSVPEPGAAALVVLVAAFAALCQARKSRAAQPDRSL